MWRDVCFFFFDTCTHTHAHILSIEFFFPLLKFTSSTNTSKLSLSLWSKHFHRYLVVAVGDCVVFRVFVRVWMCSLFVCDLPSYPSTRKSYSLSTTTTTTAKTKKKIFWLSVLRIWVFWFYPSNLQECPSSSWLSCLLVGWVVVFVVPNTSFVWCNCKSYHHHQSYTKKLHVVIILYYTMATNVLVWFWLMINYKTDIVVDIIVRSHSSGYYLINTYVVQKRKKTSTPSIKINLANNPLLFWIYTGNNNDDVDDMILAILMMNVVF